MLNKCTEFTSKFKEEKQHWLLKTESYIPPRVHIYTVNNPGNKTSIPFSGLVTLAPEWAVTALQAASGLPWKQGSGWRLRLKSSS